MRLGEILIERKLITTDDLDRALEIQKERGEKIGKVLVDLGFIAVRDVLAALSDQLSIPLVTIQDPPAVSPETESLSPPAPAALTIDGYALASWRAHGMRWWAVSDAEPAVLARLRAALTARLDRPLTGEPQ